MNNVNDKKIARIISWSDDDYGQPRKIVNVKLRDNNEVVLHNVDEVEWDRITEEELEYELSERNADVITTPEIREVVHGTVIGRVTPESRQGVCAERQTIIDRCRLADSIELCAWCQTYRGVDGFVIRLDADEFEATRHTGESHGICDECKSAQSVSIADMKKKRDARHDVTDNLKSDKTAQRRIMVLESALVNSESEIIKLKASLNTMRRQKNAYQASAVDLQTKLDEKAGM